MKKTIVILAPVCKDSDRQELERMIDTDFHSPQGIRDEFDCDVSLFTLTEFMDACNDTDDDTPSHLKIDISENWVGYVNLITN